MGLTHVTVQLHTMNGAGGEYEADFLVDTGASDSMAPAPALEQAGFHPIGSMAYELADGTTGTHESMCTLLGKDL